jgi:hypothetical protein
MKKTSLLVFFLIIYSSLFSQLKYDDGPIVLGSNFVTTGTWGKNNLTFSFQNSTNDLAIYNQQNSIRQAFQLWSDFGGINFTEVINGGDIQISFAVSDHGDGFPFDGTNGVLAHAFFPPPNGGGLSGHVHFDDDELWTDLTQSFGSQVDVVFQ